MRSVTARNIGTRSAAAFLVCCLSGSVFGTTYNDATGDGSFVTTFPHLDIASVDVTTTATHISFAINFVGDPIATNWGEYQISIDSILGGSTSGNVPPNRPYSMSSGMDYYIRSWDSGAEVYRWDAAGSFWALDHATWQASPGVLAPTKTTSSVTLTTTLAALGLSMGDSFDFDVWSAGGTHTDGAFDALANPNPTPFGEDFSSPYNAGANVFQYTVVPEPASLALGLLSVTALLMRRKGNG